MNAPNAIVQKPGDGYRPATWVNVLAGTLAAAAISGLTTGIVAWSDVQRMGDRLNDCALDVRGLEDFVLQLEGRVTTNTINRVRNEALIERLDQQVHELTTYPAARPDKFTGTMGRELEERLDARLKALEGNP